MLADGLNKGSVLRDQLRQAAETGIWSIPYVATQRADVTLFLAYVKRS